MGFPARLYAYPHPYYEGWFVYSGQGLNRDKDHRQGKTGSRSTFGRRWRNTFKGINLSTPIYWDIEVSSQQELNNLENEMMSSLQTWHTFEDGFNLMPAGKYGGIEANKAASRKYWAALTPEEKSIRNKKVSDAKPRSERIEHAKKFLVLPTFEERSARASKNMLNLSPEKRIKMATHASHSMSSADRSTLGRELAKFITTPEVRKKTSERMIARHAMKTPQELAEEAIVKSQRSKNMWEKISLTDRTAIAKKKFKSWTEKDFQKGIHTRFHVEGALNPFCTWCIQRNPALKETRDLVYQYFDEGIKTLQEIAAETGFSYNIIRYQYKKRMGIKRVRVVQNKKKEERLKQANELAKTLGGIPSGHWLWEHGFTALQGSIQWHPDWYEGFPRISKVQMRSSGVDQIYKRVHKR